jgi:anthranilate synthase component II
MRNARALRVVFVDNFDSFTFNLVHEFAQRGCEVEVWRNTAGAAHLLGRAESAADPALIVLSPGPGRPADAGTCPQLVALAAGRVPIFGVCLGQQVIVEAFGGLVERAGELVHGRASAVRHNGGFLFTGIPSPFVAGRYHSLGSQRVRPPLVELARSGELVMAVAHATLPVAGVQFHPESILTPDGGTLIGNVIAWAAAAAASAARRGAR